MAALITSYGGLSTAIGDWMARSGDPDIAARIDDLIALVEERMYLGTDEIDAAGVPVFEGIRIPEMYTANTSFALATNPVAPPTGMLELVEAYLNNANGGDGYPLDIVEESILDSYSSTDTGDPRKIALSGLNLRTWPDIGTTTTYTLTLRYYGRLTTPSGTNSTNWILTNAPNVYLYGCLLEASLMTGDFDGAAKYGILYGSVANGLNTRAQRRLASAQNVRLQLRGRTP
jgi:hypothetical protein